MLKNDLEMLVTLGALMLILGLANFGAVANYADGLYTTLQQIRQEDSFQKYKAFKDAESSFWATFKGTQANKSEISRVLQDAPPASAQPAQPAGGAPKLTTPIKFLLVGDSMMLEGFGPALENSLLAYQGVSVVREGVYSTGLNHIEYFDWYTKTDELIARHKPDLLVVMMGANDGQGIVDREGKPHEFGSPGWMEVYRQRVNAYLNRTSPQVRKIYWVGHPLPESESFMVKFSAMNPIFQTESAKFPNVVYVDAWERFAVNGSYRQSLPDDNGLWQIARKSDGVHVTEFGGGILASLVLREAHEDVDMRK